MDLLMTFDVPDDQEDTTLFKSVIKAVGKVFETIEFRKYSSDVFGTGFVECHNPLGSIEGLTNATFKKTTVDVYLKSCNKFDLAKIMCLIEYLIDGSGEDVYLVGWREAWMDEPYDDVGLGTLGALLDMGEEAVLRWWESTIPDLLEAVDGRSSVVQVP